MKLVRYGAPGREKSGMLDAQGRIRDLSKIVSDIAGEVLSPKSLAKLRKLKADTLPLVRGTPRLGACVGEVGNFIAIGLNYSDHAAEAGLSVPKEPVIFNKAPSCICGPNDDTLIPKDLTKLDYRSSSASSSAAAPATSLKTRRWTRSLATASPTTSRNVAFRSSAAVANGAKAKVARLLARLGHGSSRKMRFPIRSGSTCGSQSTVKHDRKEQPITWCSMSLTSSGIARSSSSWNRAT